MNNMLYDTTIMNYNYTIKIKLLADNKIIVINLIEIL